MANALRYMPAALLALGTLTATPACASTYGPGYRTGGYVYGGYVDRGYGDGYGDRGYYREVERVAYQNGFHEGSEAGDSDGRRGRRYEPYRHDDWRDGDQGYRRNYGDPEFYRRSFRNGFEAGYSQAYGRYSGYRRW